MLKLIDFLERKLHGRSYASILDSGCGKGRYAWLWKKHTIALDGIDANARRLRIAKRTNAYRRLIRSSILFSPSYGLIVSTYVIEHLQKDKAKRFLADLSISKCDFIVVTDSRWNPNIWPVPTRTRWDRHRSSWNEQDFHLMKPVRVSNGFWRDLIYGKSLVIYRLDEVL